MLDLESLAAACLPETILLCAMYANNETGTIFPIERIGTIAREKGIYFLCDAVQAAGKIPIDWQGGAMHLLSLSAHKLNGPKGVGALIVRRGTKLFPLLHGGSQERNRRAGTENVAGIVGLGTACQLAAGSMARESQRVRALRDRLEQGLLTAITGTRVNGHPVHRLPNTSNLSFLNVQSDSLLFNLDLAGIAASSGSACSSGALKKSHVLHAMGVDRDATVANIRFSLGSSTTDADVDQVLSTVPEIVQRLRS